ncbi:uncharacterized protein LOC127095588 [Lathyrus oleraceus]|uniref:uncharacterized protein LOC127095588 n=1 Tax=Pisum sativum TaxID=3888 RepID=UPI0021D292A6|nr:uncharacterized protein LOC127095588 [Pisum sativum]
MLTSLTHRYPSLPIALLSSPSLNLNTEKRFPVEKRIGRFTFGGDGELKPLHSARFLLQSTKSSSASKRLGFSDVASRAQRRKFPEVFLMLRSAFILFHATLPETVMVG